LVVGPSNCGKTNVMLSLIESPNGLKFENIYVFSKSLYQPKYEYLEKLIKPIKGKGIIRPHKIMKFKQDDLNMRHIYRDHVNTDRHMIHL